MNTDSGYSDAESGFYAALFENSAGERVLAFRGTEPLTPQDVSTDRAVLKAQTPDQLPQQFVEAQRIFGEISSQYGGDGLSVTGHSLGGGLASSIAANNPDVQATVFNALGIGNIVASGSYDNVKNYNSSADPVSNYGPPQIGQKCSIEAEGIDPRVYSTFGVLGALAWFLLKNHSIDSLTNRNFTQCRTFTPRIDPLALDLDSDGLEATGITATGTILFDHDGDGIRTGTGWLKGDDAFLALDKNGNGAIDNGNELFGVDTVLANGQKATSGFAALADLDSNHDGQFSSADAQFANVRLWRDLDQDGISDTGELQSLADAGIASISLSSTATNIPLTGGNVQSAAGTYTRTNGTTGALGEFTTGNTGNLDLAQNPFYREFVDQVPLTAAALALPDLQGAGAVRDLQEAASLNAALISDVGNLATLSRTGMLGQIDPLLKDWSATSALKTSQQRAADKGVKLLYKLPGLTDAELEAVQLAGTPGYDKTLILSTLQVSAARYDVVKAQVDQFSQMMDVLERFNGQTFLNFPADGSM